MDTVSKRWHEVTISDTSEVFRCREDESLLLGMERLGKRGIPVGCRGGGCGVCKVRIESGEFGKRVMNRVSIDIGPTRHGITRGTTIYAFDPSGNRFETFCGGYETYPDHQAITWTFDEVGAGIFYHDRKLNERFLTVVT